MDIEILSNITLHILWQIIKKEVQTKSYQSPGTVMWYMIGTMLHTPMPIPQYI